MNAAGVWSDDVRALDEGGDPDSIRPAKGIHITVPWEKVRNDIAVVVPVPKDKRSVFVVPWLPTDDGGFELTYIGTTDTDYDGPIDDPQCTADDVAYLLQAINVSVREPLTEADVVGTWAGLRPLVKAADQRAHRRPVAAAQGVTRSDVAAWSPSPAASSPPTARWPRTPSTSSSSTSTGSPARPAAAAPRKLKVRGAQAVDPKATGPHPPPRRPLRHRGRACSHALIDDDPSLGEPLVPGLPYVRAEAVYAARHEMATTRRRRARPPHPRPPAGARRVGRGRRRRRRPLAPELGWSADEAAAQADAYVALVDGRARRARPARPPPARCPA